RERAVGAAEPPVSEPEDDARGAFRLPDDIGAKADEAGTREGRAREQSDVRFDERGVDPAVESHADVARRKQLHASACAQREADLAVATAGVAREAEHAREERANTIAAELLQAAAEPVVDRGAGERHLAVLCRLDGQVGLLVAEEAFNLEAVRPLGRE